MRILAAFFLTMSALLFSLSAHSEETTDAPETRERDLADTDVDAGMTPGEEMSALVEKGFEHGLEAIQEARVYPFAIVRRKEEDQFSTRLIGFQGNPSDAPPAEEWQKYLYHHLRDQAEMDSRIRSIALIRQHEIEADDGTVLPALWALSDHRRAEDPTITVVPMVPVDDSSYRIGNPIYQSSGQRFFPREENEME